MHLLSRRSIVAEQGSTLSLATYFNAFPASYWKRWTTLREVTLHAELEGSGTLTIYKSNARGNLQRVESFEISGPTMLDVPLSLAPFGDGGWYWFDLTGGDEKLTLRAAEWRAADNGKSDVTVTLQITTMNKPDYCLRNLRLLAQNETALNYLCEVLIVDQGTNKVQDQSDFEQVAALIPGKLHIINQANLGGSGGFSRGMYEAVRNGSDYVLLLDDDIVMEPESIPRLATFAEYCKGPTIVGGHMFDLYNRTTLHTFGEIVNKWRIQPDQPVPDQKLGHNFAGANLRSTSWLHRRIDVDYNGWWMDLIPTEVIREIGLSLPIFIKWDDAEYGLRAQKAGYPTVSLPGAAVWHISWVDKDDLVGWQAYFHIRNRIIVGLLYSPYERGGRLLRESTYADIKHSISMQYYTEEGRLRALQDVLAGPENLHPIQPVRIQEIRRLAGSFTDAQMKESVDDFPPLAYAKPPRRGKRITQPNMKSLVPWTLKAIAHQFIAPVKPEFRDQPQAQVAHIDNKWWRMSLYDSAIVSNAEGTGFSWYRRDPQRFRRMLREALAIHTQIFAQWPKLREQYQSALPRITSLDAWADTFTVHTESELHR